MFDSGMRLAKVVRVYPDGHSVDLVMYDDNSPCSNVQVMSGAASSRSGFSGLIEPTAPPDGEWGNQDSGDEDQIAVVAFMRGEPIVLGFLFPQVNQMTFGHKNRLTIRSPSDVYITIDKNGETEIYHPSGTYLRFGEEKEHEDLTRKDFDAKWVIDRNTARAPHVHIECRNAGAYKSSVDLDPDGNVKVDATKDIDVTAQGHHSTEVQSHVKEQAGAYVENIAGSDVSYRAGSDAELRGAGKVQVVGDGPVLVKSNTRLILKGPSGVIVL